MAKHRTGYLFKRGSSFYVQWRVNGKLFSRALRDDKGEPITNRREAEDAKTKVMASFMVADEAAALESISAKLAGRRAELHRLDLEQNPPLRVADAWREFAQATNRPDTGAATMRQYEFQWGAFARWLAQAHPGIQTLSEVTKAIADAYASNLVKGGASPNTFNKHLNLLGLVFRVVKEKARLAENPWLNIQRKKLTTQSRRELTIDELRTVCGKADGELRTLLALGVYSGLRLGDCATLRWCEVDLPRLQIRRVPNKTARQRPDKEVKIPIHPVLADILRGISTENRGEYVLPETAAMYLKRTDFVTDIVQSHFKACGVKTHKRGTGTDGKRAVIEVGFHSLRHTFVSLCRESNAPLAVVESIVGHSNPAMTRHYTHIGEFAAGQAVAALPSILDHDTRPAIPARNSDPSALRRILQSMTPENWESRCAEALALLSSDNDHSNCRN